MIAATESGKVYHILRCASEDAFYRCGIAHCKKVFDEETQAVETYPGEDGYANRLPCKKCLRELNRRAGIFNPRLTIHHSEN